MAQRAPLYSPRGPNAPPRYLHFAVAIASMLFVVAAGPGGTPAPSGSAPAGTRATALTQLSTFPQVYSGVVSDYNSCQFKVSYLGAQEKLTTSLAGVSALRAGGFQRTPFLVFQYHGYYGNDAHFGDTLVVSPAEIKSLMDAILARPAMQDTTGPAEPGISLMVMRTSGPTTLCWEHCTATPAEGDTLFALLHGALLSGADKSTVDQFRHHMVGVRQ
ncbi:MAG: hypothetical protein HZB25_04575 [Candidatus Eisenbacteria bacterium]|nr:hypothetical protein [Candidatus Eisenbacteria bacterium]